MYLCCLISPKFLVLLQAWFVCCINPKPNAEQIHCCLLLDQKQGSVQGWVVLPASAEICLWQGSKGGCYPPLSFITVRFDVSFDQKESWCKLGWNSSGECFSFLWRIPKSRLLVPAGRGISGPVSWLYVWYGINISGCSAPESVMMKGLHILSGWAWQQGVMDGLCAARLLCSLRMGHGKPSIWVNFECCYYSFWVRKHHQYVQLLQRTICVPSGTHCLPAVCISSVYSV